MGYSEGVLGVEDIHAMVTIGLCWKWLDSLA